MKAPTKADFSKLLRGLLGTDVGAEVVGMLWGHYELLEKWNRVLSLTSVRDFEEIVRRHYAESLLAAVHVPRGTLADIGSGAGFPGLPIAAARPDTKVTLVEVVQKKASFLREASDLFPNVTVISDRAENLKTTYDAITARAVRPNDVLDLIPSVAHAFVLLVGDRDAAQILANPRFTCEPPVPIPWSNQTVIVRGRAVLA